ncbi:hypothetical protein GCM10009037_09970 [Halarchaeum grantii]|uniref:Uncharacterized protein n=1 Tax=Halarchaeum grantii TaxID=1193105 RepID=A0A830F0T7_9EURY|nr:hypothetical protein GCM10009037_09970 [Halarchaeum grantii]
MERALEDDDGDAQPDDTAERATEELADVEHLPDADTREDKEEHARNAQSRCYELGGDAQHEDERDECDEWRCRHGFQ